MPNVNAPYGLRPAYHRAGGTIRGSRYRIAGAYNTAIFSGDLVKGSPGTSKNIAKAVEGDRVVGVFAGCHYIEPDGSPRFRPYWPASQAIMTGTEVLAVVYDDPLIMFRARADGAVPAVSVGQLIDFEPGTGSTATGQSTLALKASTIAGSGEPLKLIELLDTVTNEYGDFAEMLVAISTHENIGGTLTGV